MLTRGPELDSAPGPGLCVEVRIRNRMGQDQTFRDVYHDLIV